MPNKKAFSASGLLPVCRRACPTPESTVFANKKSSSTAPSLSVTRFRLKPSSGPKPVSPETSLSHSPPQDLLRIQRTGRGFPLGSTVSMRCLLFIAILRDFVKPRKLRRSTRTSPRKSRALERKYDGHDEAIQLHFHRDPTTTRPTRQTIDRFPAPKR